MSEKAKWTPGPWRVADIPGEAPRILSDTNLQIARIGYISATDVANARLIAAAPEMADTLRDVETLLMIVQPRSNTKEYLATLANVRALLAKITGEPS